ncbi:cyclin-dependent kinase [Salix suchowensis]|nr:cyclin-dependent kinase [Salix suchowensis]
MLKKVLKISTQGEAFNYAEHDLYETIRDHRDKGNNVINQYTVKSLLWQLLNALNYLHSNHRDLKPSNILVMGEGKEHGVVKIADFWTCKDISSSLGGIYMWAVGCTFAELLTLKPLFQGAEAKSTPNPFQLDQLDKIFKVLGHPTLEKWPTLASLPHYVVPLSPKGAPFDLISKMLEYDPRKRIEAAQALEHDYFRSEPLPGRNALVPLNLERKVINYPTRPVDTNTDFEGTTSLQPPQPVSFGNAVSGGIPGAHGVNNRSAPRPMAIGMQRMQTQGMAAYNLSSQAGMGGGMNPGNIPVSRGVAQPHQQHHLRRKDPPGTGTGYSPQQKSRR